MGEERVLNMHELERRRIAVQAKIDEAIQKGKSKAYLFPFGKYGMMAKEILQNRYGIQDIVVLDNALCQYNSEIKPLDSLKDKLWEKNEIFFLCTFNPNIYMKTLLMVKDCVPERKICDLFWNEAFMFGEEDCEDPVRANALKPLARDIYSKKLEGSVAEAGVYRGGFAAVINVLFPDRKLYLFDTFQGFHAEMAGQQDNAEELQGWIDGGLSNTSVDLVMDRMRYPENIVIRRGVFPKSAEGLNEKFVFVNLDMDIYQSTYDGLVYFFEKLVAGGYIFVHDFGLWEGARKAVMQFCKEQKIGYVLISDNNTAVLTK